MFILEFIKFRRHPGNEFGQKRCKVGCFNVSGIKWKIPCLTLFDMDFAPMIMKISTGMKLDIFYTMTTKNCDVTTITLLRRHNL